MSIPNSYQIIPSGTAYIPQINTFVSPSNINQFPSKSNMPIVPPKLNQFRTQNIHKPHPKSKFTIEEDELLKQLVSKYGENNWSSIADLMPHRNMRQCKERWINYLSPSVCSAPWTAEEDALLEKKYKEFGRKWVRIALSFPHRTDSNVKNRWLVLSRRSKKIECSNLVSTCNSTMLPTNPSQLNVISQPVNNQANFQPLNQETQAKLPEIDTFINQIDHKMHFPLLNANLSYNSFPNVSIISQTSNLPPKKKMSIPNSNYFTLPKQISELIGAHELKLNQSLQPKLPALTKF